MEPLRQKGKSGSKQDETQFTTKKMLKISIELQIKGLVH